MSDNTNKGLMRGAVTLTIGSVVAKLLGVFYRIPLTNILGAEGMGMYQLIFPVYALLMTLSTAGIPTALSRIVAEKKANGESAGKYLINAIILLIVMGVLFTSLTMALSRVIARLQGNDDAYMGFIIIAPSILFVCVIAGFRGWFQGQMNMVPTAISNIIEQVVKLAVGIALAITLIERGTILAVYGALIGVTISEAVTMIYMLITYFVSLKGERFARVKMQKDEYSAMIKTILSISSVAILMPLSQFFDSLIIVNMLKLKGIEYSIATAQYGLLSGPVNSLINTPIVAIMSLAIAIVPSVSQSRINRNIDGVMLKSSLSLRCCYLIGIPFAIFFVIFADKIINVIYPSLTLQNRITASSMLRICAFNTVFVSCTQIYVSLLQALDRVKMAVLSLVLAITTKIVLSLLLTRFIGIEGSAIASIVMSIVSFMSVNFCYYKLLNIHLTKNISINLLLGVIMGILSVGAVFIANDIASLLVGAFISLLVYILLIFAFDIIDKDDISYLPFSKYLLKVRNTIRFWER